MIYRGNKYGLVMVSISSILQCIYFKNEYSYVFLMGIGRKKGEAGGLPFVDVIAYCMVWFFIFLYFSSFVSRDMMNYGKLRIIRGKSSKYIVNHVIRSMIKKVIMITLLQWCISFVFAFHEPVEIWQTLLIASGYYILLLFFYGMLFICLCVYFTESAATLFLCTLMIVTGFILLKGQMKLVGAVNMITAKQTILMYPACTLVVSGGILMAISVILYFVMIYKLNRKDFL